jgi:chromosome segregation ATPase
MHGNEQPLYPRSNVGTPMPAAAGRDPSSSIYGTAAATPRDFPEMQSPHEHQAHARGSAHPRQLVDQQQHLRHYGQQQGEQQAEHMPRDHAIDAPATTAQFALHKQDVDAEQELILLQAAISEAQARQANLKEDIAAVNADIAAATKLLNARRERSADLQQVCASLQQGHAGLKTVLAEAAHIPQESEGVEKMRARLFLVQANGHKARHAIQVITEPRVVQTKQLPELNLHPPPPPHPCPSFAFLFDMLQVLQAELDLMKVQVALLWLHRQSRHPP